MGDKTRITAICYLDYSGNPYGSSGLKNKYQIDLYNETKEEHYRVFADAYTLEKMLVEARALAGTQLSFQD